MRRAVPSLWFCLATLSVLTTADAPADAQRVLLSASRDDAPASTSLVDLATGAVTPFSSDFTDSSMATSDGTFVLRLVSPDTRWRVRDMASGVEVLLPFEFTPVAPHPRQPAIFGFAPGAVPARLDGSGLTLWPVCGAAMASTMRVALDGLRLFVLCSHEVVVVDTASGLPLRRLRVGEPVAVFGFVLGRDDSTLLVLRVRDDVRELARIDTHTGATLEAVPYAGPPLIESTPARDAFVGSACRHRRPEPVLCTLIVTDVDTLARSATVRLVRVVQPLLGQSRQPARLSEFLRGVPEPGDAPRLQHRGVIDGPVDVSRGRLTMGVAFPPLPPVLDAPAGRGPVGTPDVDPACGVARRHRLRAGGRIAAGRGQSGLGLPGPRDDVFRGGGAGRPLFRAPPGHKRQRHQRSVERSGHRRALRPAMMQPMASWMWLAGGLVLLAVELATPSGFFVMFFGIGALLTGLAAAAGAVTGQVPQWTLFTVSSVLSLLLFRGKIQKRVEHSGPLLPVDSLVGEIAFPVEAMAAGAVGRVALRGSNWEARNEGDTPLGANQRCRVTRVSGLQLGVVAE